MGQESDVQGSVPVALPARGEVFIDSRSSDRAMRVSWHAEVGLVVLSLWREDRCTATFRLPVAEVPALVHALVEGLAHSADPHAPRAAFPPYAGH